MKTPNSTYKSSENRYWSLRILIMDPSTYFGHKLPHVGQCSICTKSDTFLWRFSKRPFPRGATFKGLVNFLQIIIKGSNKSGHHPGLFRKPIRFRANMLTDVIYMTCFGRVVIFFFLGFTSTCIIRSYRKAFVFFWKKKSAGREIVVYRFSIIWMVFVWIYMHYWNYEDVDLFLKCYWYLWK